MYCGVYCMRYDTVPSLLPLEKYPLWFLNLELCIVIESRICSLYLVTICLLIFGSGLLLFYGLNIMAIIAETCVV